jgi:hypothetical protein
LFLAASCRKFQEELVEQMACRALTTNDFAVEEAADAGDAALLPCEDLRLESKSFHFWL